MAGASLLGWGDALCCDKQAPTFQWLNLDKISAHTAIQCLRYKALLMGILSQLT